MAPPPMSESRLRLAVAKVEEALRSGYPSEGLGPHQGAIGRAGDLLVKCGECRNPHQIYSLLKAAKARLDIEPDWSVYRLERYQQPVSSARLLPAPAPEPATLGAPRHVLVIPDRHNDPRHPHRLACSTWIARFGSEHKPTDVVDLGDACTFDSVSRHAKDDTLKGRLKPPIKDDLANHLASLQAFERGRAADWKPRLKKARGNHEQRLWYFEDANPATTETHTLAYQEHLLQFGWQERPFGEIFYLDGVGFTHAPFNAMGKPMGGVTLGNRAGALLTHSLVHGHTHQRGHYDAKKLGLTDSVSVLQCGCALPWGEVEDYASHQPTGWWWGVVLLTIQGGVITDEQWVSMLTLRDRYSDDGADIAA